MNGRDRFLALHLDARKRAQLLFCESAVLVWVEFAKANAITYREPIAGTTQELDVYLPDAALEAVRTGNGRDEVLARFLEPMVALHDGDLKLPENVEFALLSVYSLFRKYVEGLSVDDWQIVNQALGALSESEVVTRFEEVMRVVGSTAEQ